MKPILVTGATGFLGWHVARQLIEAGHRVRALVRNPAGNRLALGELPGVETATGDLRDPDSLARAVAGCGVVYHVAADYRLWAPRPEEMYRSNVAGTRNMLEAARNAGVERVVYTSTVGCIGFPEGGVGNEESPVSLTEMRGPYKRSKFMAEVAAREFATDGFPVVIVNPTAPVGDHDCKPTPTGKMIFTVLGAVAELERSLIVERVRAGLRNARAKGKMLGRPRVAVDAARIARLRAQGRSIRDIAIELGCSPGLVHKNLAIVRDRAVET